MPLNKGDKLSETVDLGHKLADAAGQSVMAHFRKPLSITDKAEDGKFDPVTLADREAEAAIRALLKEHRPGDGVVGEEFATHPGEGDLCWIVDPIDGTRAFIMGSAEWGTLIGLTDAGKPVFGMMNQPFTSERFWSEGSQSFYRGPQGNQTLLVRDCGSLDAALLSSTSPDFFEAGLEAERFDALKNKAKMTRFGGDCYAYCLLALGQIDLVVEAGLKTYDIVPLIPIIEGAGGIVTDWEGRPVENGGQVIAAGSRSAHAEAIDILHP